MPVLRNGEPRGLPILWSVRFAARCPRPVAEERKVVTALFCDLVGFTATSEAADPEDVDRMLNAYFAMARKELESLSR